MVMAFRRLLTQGHGLLEIEFGSLYPALKRLELKGWVQSEWNMSEHNRQAKFYRLTPHGRKQLRSEHSKWADYVKAVASIMEPAPVSKS